MDQDVQSTKINFIPCLKWVKRGVAKTNPEKVQLTKEELLQVINETKSKIRENDEEENGESSNINEDDEFNFAQYDNEEEVAETLGIGSLAILSPEEEDGNSDSDSEKEDDIIKPTDNLIIVGHVEGDASILEIYVHNDDEGSLYVHHDIFLPSFPLCLEWLDHEPGENCPGNLCAIGTMSPVIDVWDLDIVNSLEPAFTLGQEGSRRKKIKKIGHYDAVLDLAWNKSFHHILASGSVDKTVLLWDLDAGVPHTTLKNFSDKVQSLKWHPSEARTLLVGSCDKTVKMFDCLDTKTFKSWDLEGEAERVIWDPLAPFSFLVGTNNGFVQCFDYRKGLLWNLEAHEKEVTGIAVSDSCKGLMLTSSTDGHVNIWDHSYNNIPKLIHSKDMKMDALHCLELCPDLPFVFAAGANKRSNNLAVLDVRSIDPVNHCFGSRTLINTNENMDTNE